MRFGEEVSPAVYANLLSAFAQGLAHKLRNPLSVVSNELCTLSRLIGEQHCSLALKHCREISQVLRGIDTALRLRSFPGNVSCRELLESFLQHELISEISPGVLDIRIDCDLSSFASVWNPFYVKLAQQKDMKVRAKVEARQTELFLSLLTPFYATCGQQSGRTFYLLSEIALDLLDGGMLDASLADAVLPALGVRFQAQLDSDGLHLMLSFPLSARGCE